MRSDERCWPRRNRWRRQVGGGPMWLDSQPNRSGRRRHTRPGVKVVEVNPPRPNLVQRGPTQSRATTVNLALSLPFPAPNWSMSVACAPNSCRLRANSYRFRPTFGRASGRIWVLVNFGPRFREFGPNAGSICARRSGPSPPTRCHRSSGRARHAEQRPSGPALKVALSPQGSPEQPLSRTHQELEGWKGGSESRGEMA